MWVVLFAYVHKACKFHYCAYHIYDVAVLPAINNEQIRCVVMNGYRPPLDVITGPAELVSFATRWIPLCWHESPEQRPTFHGKCQCSRSRL